MTTMIENLPSELLRIIFKIYYDSRPYSPTRIPTQTHAVERVISQVSRRWRLISFDMPQLWRRIVVDYERTRGQEKKHADQTQDYLSRSKEVALVVFWKHMMNGSHQWEPDTGFWDIVQATITHSARWLSLHIVTDTTLARQAFISHLGLPFVPQLHHFSFHADPTAVWQEDEPTKFPEPPFDTISNARSLSRLELSSQNPRHIVLSGSSISTLILHLTIHINCNDLPQMLQSLPKLEKLVLNRPAKNAFSFRIALHNVVLPLLQTLVISSAVADHDPFPGIICDALSAPRLRSLHLVGHREFASSKILGRIERSHNSLSRRHPTPLYPNLQTFDFRPLRHDMRLGFVFSPYKFFSIVVNLIVQGNKMESWFLHPPMERAFQALRMVTLYCGTSVDPFDFDHGQPRCSCDGVRLLREFVELRVGRGDLPLPRLRISIRCLQENQVDEEWLRGMVQVETLPECLDDPWEETAGGFEVDH